MKKISYLASAFVILGILSFSKMTMAQNISFEVNLPGIHIAVGDPYVYVIDRPRIIYYRPMPEGYYYYDERDGCYYNDDGDVYYYPTNVYVRHDNGKHKGWYKKRHRHEREDDDHD